MKPLVSIIIPTYNRATLLGETLDSIVAQSYTQWECIVVDDGSDDATDLLMKKYCDADTRFQYHHRPLDRPRGGNAARNYGFEMSSGALVQWFDSDDLMTLHKLELKVAALQDANIDFVISKTKYFNKDIAPFAYDFLAKEMTFSKYAMGSVSWFTPDLMVKREYVENVAYNEELRAGQEYNFVCKLLTKNIKGVKISEFLTLRRWHEDSIGNKRKRDVQHYLETKFYSHWTTYQDVKKIVPNPAFERYGLLKCMISYCNPKARFGLPKNFMLAAKEVFGLRAYYVYLAKISGRFVNRPYYFYNKIK